MGEPASLNERDRQRAWTTYWHSGALHSCPTSFVGNYAGAIAEFWTGVGKSLPSPARVLDLGTGNGSIPKLLMDIVADPALVEVDGVDAAQIAPAWHSAMQTPRVRFHSGVQMEGLPFAAATFDVVCSQFAIEYAPAPDAWREALRVLRPQGSLYWVMHHRESIFTKVATQERDHLVWLLQASGLFAAATDLAPWLMRHRAGDASVATSEKANAARSRFNEIQRALESRIHTSTSADVLGEVRTHLHAILAKSAQPLAALNQYCERLEEALLRCSDLVDRALDSDGVGYLASWLDEHRPNTEIGIKVLQQEEGIIAWGLTLRGL